MGNEIPTKVRKAVDERDQRHCLRCGMRGNHKHHRKRRRERDHYPHCLCNVITLCGTCHAAVHAEPTVAQTVGFIVAPWSGKVPEAHNIRTFQGWMRLHCDGSTEFVD